LHKQPLSITSGFIPARFASIAQANPVGPAPTQITSYVVISVRFPRTSPGYANLKRGSLSAAGRLATIFAIVLTLRASDLRVRHPAHLSVGWILTIKAETLSSPPFPREKGRLFVVFPASM
jgi:hypothetical protein